MRSRFTALLKLSRCSTNHFLYQTEPIVRQGLKPSFSSSSSTDDTGKPSQPKNRDSILLETFRLRKKKGSSKTPQNPPPVNTEKESEQQKGEPSSTTPKLVSGYKELGLREHVVAAVEDLGLLVPRDIHCVSIPPLLEGKSVMLGSLSGSSTTLTYLLPFIQLLKEDEEKKSIKPNHPRALILCTTEELSDEVFRMAKFISHYHGNGLKPIEEEDAQDGSIGMFVGTPNEVFELIEDGDVVLDEIKYLVLDEVDTMLDLGFDLNIKSILSSINSHPKKLSQRKLQSVLVTSTMIKMLHERLSLVVGPMERDNAGEISALLLELEEAEVFHLIECPDALKRKVADAVDSLCQSTQGS